MIWGLIYSYEIDEWMNRVFSLEITFVTFDTIWDLVTKKNDFSVGTNYV